MENIKMCEIHFAPLQGYTDWIYRNAYDRFFGGVDAYYTPFVRVEKGNMFRRKDLRDIEPANNQVARLIPQLLPGSGEELVRLSSLLTEKGYAFADINLGCPFPMIVGKNKGAGMLPYPGLVRELLETACKIPGLRFSVKMRLGWSDPEECLRLLPLLNELPLEHITLHARTGKQQYKGITDPEAFGRFYEECRHPLFYNGDLGSVEDITLILKRFEKLKGVVIGRGLLASPFLVKDFRGGETFAAEERLERLKAFHKALFEEYAGYLQDEHQLLVRMKSLWDYFLPETDRHILKQIKKANRLSQYNEAINKL